MTDVVPSPAARAAVTKPRCPHCREELQLGSWQLRHDAPLDCWACPGAHGVALTMAESYEQMQEDELARLWELARAGSPGPLPGPFGGPPMVRILLPYDDDEAKEGEEGDTEDVGAVELDVDLDNQFIWFDAGELEQLPADLPDPEPTAEENAAVAQITRQFSEEYGAALDARDDHEISERIYQRIARRPGMLRTFERIGRATTSY
jgi:Zn-finger nucleic acid-binding protein